MRRSSWGSRSAWAVWAVATVAAVYWVARYARRLPYANEWEIYDVVVGLEPFSLGWLWEQTAEHRLVLTRATLFVAGRLGDGDLRGVVWLNLALLATCSAAAILTMRRLRGHTSIADAFFPLVLLSPFQAGLSYAFAVHFTTVAVASVGVLLILSCFGLDAPPRWLWTSVALMVVLYLDGGPGLALLPGLLAWLAWSALRLRRTARAHGTALLAVPGAFAIGFGLYFVGLSGGDGTTTRPASVVRFALRVATSTTGPAADEIWPLSAVAALVALLVTAAMLVARWRSVADARLRSRAAALCCFGISVAGLLLAIGYGRGRYDWSDELGSQYSPLIVPVACWLYVAWVASTPRLRDVSHGVLALLAVVVFSTNLGHMSGELSDVERATRDFEQGLCRVDTARLVHRHPTLLFIGPSPEELEVTTEQVDRLIRAGIGRFDCRR